MSPLDRVLSVLFFLLRVGEYTLPSENRTTRTCPIPTVGFPLFGQGQTLLPLNSATAILEAASIGDAHDG
jgi:hypothetical protein